MRSRSTDFCLLILSHFRSCTILKRNTVYRSYHFVIVSPLTVRFDMLEKRYRFLETESIVEMKKKKQLIHRSHEWPDEN